MIGAAYRPECNPSRGRAPGAPEDADPGKEPRAKRATILAMHIFEFFMAVLEIMFFVGLAGSSIVVIISFFEDAKELFGKD